jgi:hypothetical protein
VIPSQDECRVGIDARTAIGGRSVSKTRRSPPSRAGGLTLATRNVTDFSGIERLTLVDPWED